MTYLVQNKNIEKAKNCHYSLLKIMYNLKKRTSMAPLAWLSELAATMVHCRSRRRCGTDIRSAKHDVHESCASVLFKTCYKNFTIRALQLCQGCFMQINMHNWIRTRSKLIYPEENCVAVGLKRHAQWLCHKRTYSLKVFIAPDVPCVNTDSKRTTQRNVCIPTSGVSCSASQHVQVCIPFTDLRNVQQKKRHVRQSQ